MDRIILHVYYKGAPGAAKQFVQSMIDTGLQAEVQAEDGCMQYDYFFPALGDDRALLLECWRDADALRVHSTSPAMVRLRALKESLGLETVIERYE